MKHRESVLLSLLALAALVCGQEGGALEARVFCNMSSVDVVRAEIMALWNPSEVEVYINCLAFDAKRRLETGIVSAMPRDGTPGTRYTLSCQNNALLAMQSNHPAIFNITQEESTVCVECLDVEIAANVCSKACPNQCERCAQFSVGVLCTDCHRYRLLHQYTPGTAPTAEQIEQERERLERIGEEEECTDNPVPDPDLPTSFSCVATCPDNGNHSAPSEKDHTCYACGLEYCVECELGEETGGRSECTTCLAGTVLFEGECYSCPLALIARTAIVQEDEEREELEAQHLRQIELAVTLPVISVLVIVVFILLSVYAHRRYPHVSHKGHKRHRTKPDVFTAEQTASTSTIPSRFAGEPEPLQESHVWRAQPSIRFR